jgi:hypothetical protein
MFSSLPQWTTQHAVDETPLAPVAVDRMPGAITAPGLGPR